VILAEVIRSGFAESCHRGSVVVLGPDGQAVLRAGETRAAAFPRSANKPMQAAGMLRAGLDLDGKLLALAAASHSGEAFHVTGVPGWVKTPCAARPRCRSTSGSCGGSCARVATRTGST
jgi:L-asparaginase II